MSNHIEKSALGLMVDGEKLTLTIPQQRPDRAMNEAEAFLMACYAVWVASTGQNRDLRARSMRNHMVSLASALVNEDYEDDPSREGGEQRKGA